MPPINGFIQAHPPILLCPAARYGDGRNPAAARRDPPDQVRLVTVAKQYVGLDARQMLRQVARRGAQPRSIMIQFERDVTGARGAVQERTATALLRERHEYRLHA